MVWPNQLNQDCTQNFPAMSSHLSAEAKGGGDCLETTLRDSNPIGLLRSIRLALALAMSCLDGFHSRSKRFVNYTTRPIRNPKNSLGNYIGLITHGKLSASPPSGAPSNRRTEDAVQRPLPEAPCFSHHCSLQCGCQELLRIS